MHIFFCLITLFFPYLPTAIDVYRKLSLIFLCFNYKYILHIVHKKKIKKEEILGEMNRSLGVPTTTIKDNAWSQQIPSHFGMIILSIVD